MKKIPEFISESEERAFWEENDSSDYLDWNQAKLALPENLWVNQCKFFHLS